MSDSILATIRKLIGGEENGEYFDTDLLLHINSAISRLYQIGVKKTRFEVTGVEQTWNDYLGDEYSAVLPLVKEYIHYYVRNAFDPPTSSFVLTNINDKMKELEWEINIEVDPKIESNES